MYEANPFTLALSSGFFGFFAHLGFIKALEEKNLYAKAYTGSSSGAIVAAALASGWRTKDLEELFLSVKFRDFFDPRPGLGFVRGRRLEVLLSKYMKPDFAQLEKPLRISVFDILKGRTVSVTEGGLPRIVRASCAIPMVFHPVRVGTSYFWDGGILDKMAVEGVPSDEPLLSHFLTSSVYERPSLSLHPGPLRHRVQLRSIPRCGPHKLHLGKEIIAAAHSQARKALEAPNNSLHRHL